MAKIFEKQNEPNQIDLLAAQRQMYADAKAIHSIGWFLSVPATIAVFLLTYFIPQLQTPAILWGVVITLLDVTLFSNFEKSLRLRAAKIQEVFDCDVLQLEWDTIVCGSKPPIEDVSHYAKKHLRRPKNYKKIVNWYIPKEIDNLPVHESRILCQRQNVVWEAGNRKQYTFVILILLLILTAAALGLALAKNMRMYTWLVAVVAPLLPIYAWGIPLYHTNREAAANMNEVREKIDNLWEDAFTKRKSPDYLTADARKLQNKIFYYRQSLPSVANWLYKWFRTKNEKLYAETTGRMVQEALNRAIIKVT